MGWLCSSWKKKKSLWGLTAPELISLLRLHLQKLCMGRPRCEDPVTDFTQAVLNLPLCWQVAVSVIWNLLGKKVFIPFKLLGQPNLPLWYFQPSLQPLFQALELLWFPIYWVDFINMLFSHLDLSSTLSLYWLSTRWPLPGGTVGLDGKSRQPIKNHLWQRSARKNVLLQLPRWQRHVHHLFSHVGATA